MRGQVTLASLYQPYYVITSVNDSDLVGVFDWPPGSESGSVNSELRIRILAISVADPDPGSGAFLTPGSGIRNGFFPDPGFGAFLTPGSGIRNRFFPDPGSQIHIFESLLVTIFWVKSSIIL